VIAAIIKQAAEDDRAALEFLEEFGPSVSHSPLHSQHLAEALRVCVAIGAVDLANGLLAGAETNTARGRALVVTGGAVIAEAQGDREEAARRYSDAVEQWSQYGCVLEHGQTLLGAGRCLIAAGRAAEAVGPLKTARSVFARLNATPLHREAERLLAVAA
jgi:hypothetical protein